MRKTIIRLGAGVLGAALLLPGMALAGSYGYGGPGSVTTITHVHSSHARGGPPSWAPAHGYRHKQKQRHYARHHQPVVIYHAPVYRAPVYHAPAPVYYHEPSRSTVDFSIHYRTRF